MNKIKKSLYAFFIAAMLLCVSNISVFAIKVPDPADNFYVSDYADVLSKSTEEHIVSKNDYLYDQCGAQICIVTINGLGGENIGDYAQAIFNEWGIGSADKNNGVLLLMSIGDEDYWLLQGKGLEKTLSSGTVGVLLDEYLEPYFAEEDYDGGTSSIFDALYDKLSGIYGIYDSGDYNGNYENDSNGTHEESSSGQYYYNSIFGGPFSWIFTIIAVIAMYSIVRGLMRGVCGHGVGDNAAFCMFCPCSPCDIWGNSCNGGPPRGGGFRGGNHYHGGFGGYRGGGGGFSGGGFGGGGSRGGGGGSRGGGGGSSRGGGAGRGRR